LAEPIDEHFLTAVTAMSGSAGERSHQDALRDGSSLTVGDCLALFDAQVGSRHLDLAARWLRSHGNGYYTIGSSGHEGNAAVAAALRPTDPALLHYRSGGFFLARAAQVLWLRSSASKSFECIAPSRASGSSAIVPSTRPFITLSGSPG